MAYQKTVPTPTDASIILTYRCPMKCKMCNIWFNPTKMCIRDRFMALELFFCKCLNINFSGGYGGILYNLYK